MTYLMPLPIQAPDFVLQPAKVWDNYSTHFHFSHKGDYLCHGFNPRHTLNQERIVRSIILTYRMDRKRPRERYNIQSGCTSCCDKLLEKSIQPEIQNKIKCLMYRRNMQDLRLSRSSRMLWCCAHLLLWFWGSLRLVPENFYRAFIMSLNSGIIFYC